MLSRYQLASRRLLCSVTQKELQTPRISGKYYNRNIGLSSFHALCDEIPVHFRHVVVKTQVDGHTDSTGGDEYNQQLSEKRAASVRDYLVQQGIPISSVAVMGFGKTQPVAANSTAAGRQQNRRVELVVSGEVIGTPIGGNSNLVRPQNSPENSTTVPAQPQRQQAGLPLGY